MRELVVLFLAICLPALATDLVARSINIDAEGNPMSVSSEHQASGDALDRLVERLQDSPQLREILQPRLNVSHADGGDGDVSRPHLIGLHGLQRGGTYPDYLQAR